VPPPDGVIADCTNNRGYHMRKELMPAGWAAESLRQIADILSQPDRTGSGLRRLEWSASVVESPSGGNWLRCTCELQLTEHEAASMLELVGPAE